MGYHLTSVYAISPMDVHSYYVFYVGDRFTDTISQWIDKNFATIAGALGPNAAIVRGIADRFDVELMQVYEKQLKTVIIQQGLEEEIEFSNNLDRVFLEYERGNILQNPYGPFLFVTNKNPNLVGNTGDDGVFYFIPHQSQTSARSCRCGGSSRGAASEGTYPWWRCWNGPGGRGSP